VRPKGRAKYALWPNDALNLRNVQDEVDRLANGDLLSKENPEDRKIAEKLLPRIYWNEKEKLTFEEKIDKVIGSENEWSKDFASYFLKLARALFSASFLSSGFSFDNMALVKSQFIL